MNDTILFCGPEDQVTAEAHHRTEALALMSSGREAPAPKPFEQQGAVAAIDITGSLINGNAGFMSYFGYTGYSDIRNSLVAAVADQSVGSILLNVDSGGGHVAGVHELAQLIARVDKVKPVVTYTGGTMASAALWLGSSARKSFTGETAMVGSLGILQVHIDRTEQMKQDGVKATVIRAGADKALANPYEPLSDKAKAAMQDQADQLYAVFLDHVAAQRKMPSAAADKKFGGGRVFVGQQAVDANLVDSVGSYEDAFAHAAKLADKRANNSRVPAASMSAGVVAANIAASQPSEQPQMPSTALPPETLAAMAGVELEPAQAAVVEAPAPAAAAEAPAPAAEATAPEAVASAAAEPAPANELVTYLKAELATASADLLAAKMEAKTAIDALAESKTQFDAALDIARASVRTMLVGLNSKTDALATMGASELLAEHGRVAVLFKEKFKVDRVAAVSPESQPAATKPALVDPLFAARINRQK